MTMTQLAAEVSVDKGTFSKIENGKVEPKAALVERVAGALGVPMARFYGPLPDEDVATA